MWKNVQYVRMELWRQDYTHKQAGRSRNASLCLIYCRAELTICVVGLVELVFYLQLAGVNTTRTSKYTVLW